MFAALVAEHRGFFLREGVGQTMSVEAMEGSIRSGGLYFSPVHRPYVDSIDNPVQ